MILRDIRDYFKKKVEDSQGKIPYFVFGIDEKALRESVGTFDNIFMFVDYGQIESSIDKMNRIYQKFELAVTIAKPVGANPLDNDALNEVSFECYELAVAMAKDMYTAQRERPWMKNLSDSFSIMPFVAPDIARSIGCTLSFKVEGYDMLGFEK